jgi:hypothetical protein
MANALSDSFFHRLGNGVLGVRYSWLMITIPPGARIDPSLFQLRHIWGVLVAAPGLLVAQQQRRGAKRLTATRLPRHLPAAAPKHPVRRSRLRWKARQQQRIPHGLRRRSCWHPLCMSARR